MAENTEQYMPSEQGVRAGYVWLSAGDNEGAREVAEADFDRWLAVHDARVKAEALREAKAGMGEWAEESAIVAGDAFDEDTWTETSVGEWLDARADRIEQEARR